MWIVAIAWIYVVGLMALAEADSTSVVAGLMTFLFYCIVPLSILYYLTGSKRRKAKRDAELEDGVDALESSMPADIDD